MARLFLGFFGENPVEAAVLAAMRLDPAGDTPAATVTRGCSREKRPLPSKVIKDLLLRLDLLYIDQPLYFVTFATRDHKSIPSLNRAQLALEQYARRGMTDFNVALGRYVIMPDHVHLFVRGDRSTGFFDHILRSDESSAEKWNYVRDTPIRAGLVKARTTGDIKERPP